MAIDPLGRDFGVAVAIPDANDEILGRLVFVNTVDLTVIRSDIETGFHPDMVTFTPDGSKILIANEGEPDDMDQAGSITVVDVSGVDADDTVGDINAMNAVDVLTVDFTGSDVSSLRIHPVNEFTPHLDIEPEYITATNEFAYVSLQENNGWGRFNFATNTWDRIHSCGYIYQTIDASDRDGEMPADGEDGEPSIMIDDVVRGMPMPDAVASLGASLFCVLYSASYIRFSELVMTYYPIRFPFLFHFCVIRTLELYLSHNGSIFLVNRLTAQGDLAF